MVTWKMELYVLSLNLHIKFLSRWPDEKVNVRSVVHSFLVHVEFWGLR